MKFFIDTNVFVHWIILKQIKERPGEEQKDLWKRFKKIKPSYNLLETIRKSKTIHKVVTSNMAISEVFYGIVDEYKCRQMYTDGQPLSSWSRIHKRFKLGPRDTAELVGEATDALKNLGIFKHETKERCITACQDQYDYYLISQLVCEKNLRTHDSILISTAIYLGCDYFVTRDKELRSLKLDDITIISPDAAIKHFR